jgi:hypothetical protein
MKKLILMTILMLSTILANANNKTVEQTAKPEKHNDF